MRANYPSDISPEKFKRIQPLLENARKTTRPRRVELYEVFCAVLYLLRTGCQWRALPSDFPKWRTVHAYFAIWGPKGCARSEEHQNGAQTPPQCDTGVPLQNVGATVLNFGYFS